VVSDTVTVSVSESTAQYTVTLISAHASVSGVEDGDQYFYGSEIQFTADASNGYFDVIVRAAVGDGEFSIVESVNGIYSILVMDDITIRVSASASPVDPEIYKVTVNYDSEFISVGGVPSGGTVSAGDSISVSVTGSILVEEVYVTVTMGGNTVDAFQYSSGSLTAGTVSIDHVTGDVTITVDYKEVQIVSPSSEKSFPWWILAAIVLISLLIFFLFYGRRKVVFENDSVTVTIDGNPIDSGSKIRKGDILTIQTKANGYRYTVSNATGSDGTYTVDGRRGNVVITSETDTVQ
jgi:hypothetical protein